MAYNKFTVHLIVRIALILANLIGISYVYHRGDLLYTVISLFLLLVVQIAGLVQSVNKTNRELSKFIVALRDTDYTAKFPTAENESFHLLYERFQNTLDLYKSKETKYEAQYLFIQELIDHIETGLMAFDENNKVVVINRIARQMRSEYRFEGNRTLVSVLEELSDSQMITGLNPSGHKVELLINKSSFKLLDQVQTIFTFKDISSPLVSREIESWQKLIRILAHEIINSLTPITSLSGTALLILNNAKSEEVKSDIELSLKTIRDRSEGLLTFMEDYRRLIKVPPPKPEIFDIKVRLQRILHLFKTQLEGATIELSVAHDECFADPVLFEQVLVNLLTNSIQAMESRSAKQLKLNYTLVEDWVCLSLKDNGCGMDADAQSKALIPFFTTKESGSGIGLSLVQQIVNLHRGRVEIESLVDAYTQINIYLPVSKMKTDGPQKTAGKRT